MKFSVRFTVAALVLVESTLFCALALQRGLERRHLQAKQAEEQQTALRRLARVAQDSTLQQNEVFLLNYLKVLKDAPEVRYAAFVDENGLVRVHTAMLEGKPAIGLPLAKDPTASELSSPLLKGSRPAGSVHIGFDPRVLRQAVLDDLAESRRPLLWTGLILSLLAWLGAAWLARSLAAPLEALHEGARALGAGRLDFRISLPRNDELGGLAEGFNRMAAELERLDKFKEQLMASITHDLRSPLLAIQGHAEILLTDDQATTEERRESAQLIHENAQRMSAMTNDLTDLVKLQMGRLEVSRQPVRLEAAFETTRRLLDVVAKRLDVRLETEVDGALAEVSADPSHLQRVLTNLVSNALKFTPSGGRVLMRAIREEHHIKVVVSDTGTGIPPEKLKNLFTRFTGAEGVKHGQRGLGTGLGLSICRELIEQHGGNIRAESEWKKGTRVSFTLPLGDKPCSAAC